MSFREDELVSRFDSETVRILAKSPSFDAILSKISVFLKEFGISDLASLIGRQVAIFYAAFDSEECQTEFIERKPSDDRIFDLGWTFQIAVVESLRCYGDLNGELKNLNTIIIDLRANDSDGFSILLDSDHIGEWNQDWFPQRGKYRFL
jgi:hypothetical protein